MAESGRNGGFGWGFMVGTFLGGLAGVLIAPKQGKELRSELRQRGTEAYGSARDIYTGSCGKAKAVLDEAQLRATELKKEIDRQFTVTRLRMREIFQTAAKEGGPEEKPPEAQEQGQI